jgi:hypothetical protein
MAKNQFTQQEKAVLSQVLPLLPLLSKEGLDEVLKKIHKLKNRNSKNVISIELKA